MDRECVKIILDMLTGIDMITYYDKDDETRENKWIEGVDLNKYIGKAYNNGKEYLAKKGIIYVSKQ